MWLRSKSKSNCCKKTLTRAAVAASMCFTFVSVVLTFASPIAILFVSEEEG